MNTGVDNHFVCSPKMTEGLQENYCEDTTRSSDLVLSIAVYPDLEVSIYMDGLHGWLAWMACMNGADGET